jgi:hypothetical protein
VRRRSNDGVNFANDGSATCYAPGRGLVLRLARGATGGKGYSRTQFSDAISPFRGSGRSRAEPEGPVEPIAPVAAKPAMNASASASIVLQTGAGGPSKGKPPGDNTAQGSEGVLSLSLPAFC